MSGGAKGAVKAAGRTHGGNGRVPGLCWHLGSPQAGSCQFLPLILGVPPCPSPGGSRRRSHPSHQPFTARGAGLATKQLPAAPCGCSGWLLLCFVPVWRVLGSVSGVWSSTWKLKTAKGHAHMASPRCRSTAGEGGEMDGEGKQNKTSIILYVSDDLSGSSFW